MLHDLSSRSTLPKLIPAFPIRFGPVILTSFAKQTSSRNTALRLLSSNTQLLLRNVTTIRHIAINLPLFRTTGSLISIMNHISNSFIQISRTSIPRNHNTRKSRSRGLHIERTKRQSFKVYSMHAVQLCRLQSLLEIPADFWYFITYSEYQYTTPIL